MRRTHTPAIPPQLYRHFAIVTIVLTLALAMFAEGENGEAARALATQQQAQVPRTPTPPKLVVASSAPQPAGDSGGGGWDLDFGSPMEQLRDGGVNANPASGGYSVNLSPGLSYAVTPATRIYGFVQKPLVQYVNTDPADGAGQLAAPWSLAVGVSRSF